MPCEYCENLNKITEIRNQLGSDIKLNYCPVCGSDINISGFILSLKLRFDEYAQEAFKRVYIEHEHRKETVEIDGEILPVVRIKPLKKSPISKPLPLAVDLDKIDISREMAMIQEHYGGHPLEQHREHISERVIQKMKEKQND